MTSHLILTNVLKLLFIDAYKPSSYVQDGYTTNKHSNGPLDLCGGMIRHYWGIDNKHRSEPLALCGGMIRHYWGIDT